MNGIGAFEQQLASGQFVVTAELSPPDSADPEEVYSRARVFEGYVDAINATDGSGANCHMSSVAVCSLLERRGYTAIMQVSCRDRNRLAVQGDVLGASALGISNVLCLSGDGVQAGDHPGAKPVFDLDSMSLITTLRTMRDDSRFLSGRVITTPPRILIGAAANPFVPPFDYRIERLAKKISAGAAFVQTQYCFDIPRLEEYMRQVRDRGLHEKCAILVGVGPLNSHRAARWIRDNVPGVHIPDHVIKRLEGAERPKLEGRRLCMELIQQIREIEGVAGVHVMAYRQEEALAEIIDASGVLAGRVPCSPAAKATSVLRSAIS
ncbi:MAG: methylenetetrahydrofolate reductase [Gammaproteobacteria bacterium]|jgi:methylenetetrahydrofolate reductase (NADPH)|nr:methylenetetrahydrofolate reductase [Gammaproteobacteria bacterium]